MALIDLNGLSRFKTKLATIFAPLSHDHDSRYYTENEMDSKLIAKADKTATVSTVTYDSNNKKITKTICIEGMSCGHCSKRVEEALKSVDGVKSVMVSLEEKKAEVILKNDVTNEILKDAVQDIGFEVVDIKIDI